MDLQNVAAVNGGSEQQIIGFLCWYSVGDALYEREELKNLMLMNGIDVDYMPNKIRSADAFRRATKAIETKKVPTKEEGVYQNFIVRNVASDKTIIQRNIVVETVDTKGKRLDYNEKAALLMFKREQEEVVYAALEQRGMAEELAQKACKLYQHFLTHHNGQAVRASVIDILKSMSPTPVRPSGGVYFVPAKHELKLHALISFLRQLETGEGYMIPLINTDENKDMVRTKLMEHLKNTLNNCSDVLKQEDVPSGQLNILIEDAKRVVADFKDYREILSDTVADMESYVDLIRRQVQLLIEK